jgi:uncharacterized coiled-coil protein SlyX
MDIDARAFGQLEGEVKALAQTLDAQNKTLEAQSKTLEHLATQLAAVSTTLAEARGGWRTLIWIAGASASAAGAVTWILQHLTFRVGS